MVVEGGAGEERKLTVIPFMQKEGMVHYTCGRKRYVDKPAPLSLVFVKLNKNENKY